MAIATDAVEVYWWDDHRGVRLPSAARLSYFDGKAWSPIKGEVGIKPDAFNVVSFDTITTKQIRLEIDGVGTSSVGVLEWRVRDAGTSPDFPPVPHAGVDRTLMEGGTTFLTGTFKSTGKAGQSESVMWSKKSGPGEATFSNAAAANTAATFSAPGEYELMFTTRAGELSATDALKVRVQPAVPLAKLSPVELTRYSLGGAFWSARAKAMIVNWVPHCAAVCENLGDPRGGLANFIEAGKKNAGRPANRQVGQVFADAWVLNTFEAMCVATLVDVNGDAEVAAAQAKLRTKIDEWKAVLIAAQEPDGYMQTRFTLGMPGETEPAARWDPRHRGDHEGYIGGYFIECGIAHYFATDRKDRTFLDAAIKLADCWEKNIGPAPKKTWYDGHEEMEMALGRLANVVDEIDGGKGDRYRALAKFLVDCRGSTGSPDEHVGYDQSDHPATRQYAANGHAVRAAYYYAAMTDVVHNTAEPAYQSAVLSIWDNLVNRKFYLTGGIGSGETAEGFGKDYSLPNRAYCESCANAGMLFFQQRMNLSYGLSKYADLSETTIYNALLSDIDLDGQNFTYTNSLDTSDMRYKWHDCPCCVGNIPRVLLAMPRWMYSTSADALYINLYVASTTPLRVAGGEVTVKQSGDYPWNGHMTIEVSPASPRKFDVRLRLPQRDVSALYTATPKQDGVKSVTVNGSPVESSEQGGYVVISREWKAGDKIEMDLPLAVQRIHADERIASTRGRVALRYGPLVYNFEEVDQNNLDAVLSPDAELKAVWEADLLGGVMAIEGRFADGSPLLAIPNYARNNRGKRSIVWVKEKP